jgi:hypothetical protein
LEGRDGEQLNNRVFPPPPPAPRGRRGGLRVAWGGWRAGGGVAMRVGEEAWRGMPGRGAGGWAGGGW